ncbi:MAG: thiamine-binding protein, partial [Candidatus Thermoplasmatota archaeon]|nr:thiamine-binding protein [Candidatus Thermoplasmatota archaeon]
IAKAVEVIKAHGLEHEVGPSGTTIVGPLRDVILCLEDCHETLAAEGHKVRSVVEFDIRQNFRPNPIRAQVDKVTEHLTEMREGARRADR